VSPAARALLPPVPADTTEEIELVPVDRAGPARASSAQTYVVQKGDNLCSIAKHFYGDSDKWRPIFDNNRDVLSSPDLLRPGLTLKIPSQADSR
jgi:nucleoid-associated protein YgaU